MLHCPRATTNHLANAKKQADSGRVDAELCRCKFFPPAEIEPVSWEIP
jgi:hypothetical protein